MKEVLTHSSSGYYMTRDVFGSAGDFITSPEISQIFGELLAIWCLDQWYKMGSPVPLNIVELGPGRGTLSDDLLRVLSQFDHVKNHLALHMVEISPVLAKLQIQKLCKISPSDQQLMWNSSGPVCFQGISHHKIPSFWYLQLEDVPKQFSIFIAHEFFDALPIHKFKKTDTGWKEILIDVDISSDELRFVLSRHATPVSKLLIKKDETRTELELSPQAGVLIQELATRVVEDGGVTLIADYGHSGEKTDTFRAFKKHQLVNPLCEPGTADLTADVDFSYLKSNALEKEVLTYGPVSQAIFLTNLGINIRLQKLLQTCSASVAEQLKSGCQILTDPHQMGERFKFFAFYPAVMATVFKKLPPSGFTSPVKNL